MWFQWKGQGQIQGQICKIVQKRQMPYYLLLFYQSLLKWEELVYTTVNYNVKTSNMSNENLTMLCFHGGIQDGVERPIVNILENVLSQFRLFFFGIVVIREPQAKLYSNKLINA